MWQNKHKQILTVTALLMKQDVGFLQTELIRLLGYKGFDTLHLWNVCVGRKA